MGDRIAMLGSIKHPIPYRMAKNLFVSYFDPCALGAPASDDLSVFERREDVLFFHSIWASLPFYNGCFAEALLHEQPYITTKNTFIVAHVAILLAREGI